MTARVVVSGCSGGGKSTLIAELGRRGFATFPEPGRMVVREELAKGGDALPWTNAAAFAERALRIACGFHAEARGAVAFFDRSAVDQLAWFERTGTPLPPDLAGAAALRYHPTVILAPPWPELHHGDPERRLDFGEALAEYEDLARTFPARGYEVVLLPRGTVEERADWLLARLGEGLRGGGNVGI